MKIAYLDCFSGISGDMFLGALLDAGFAFEELKHRLRTLPLDGYHLETKQELRNQISGTRFSVKLDSEKQIPRNLEAIRKIIQAGDLSRTVKEKSTAIFEQLAGIEGKIHNLSPELVHFHEVGALDSIVDIVGSLIGIEHLEIHSIYASHIPLGSGFTETAHGTIPIPAPATIELLKGIPVYDSDIRHEMVTPTGAALLKCLVGSFGPMPPMVVQDVGYGAGMRDLPERPNLLRILIGDEPLKQQVETIVILETNLDDTSPEWMGYLMERLFEGGALDVVFFPIQMKKNRPGVQIQVIGLHDQREALTEILFKESATLGVRFRYSQRQVLKRSEAEVDSPWGNIKVKKIMNRDGSYFFQPEYDVCREIALKYDRPLREIYHWITGLNK
jgi:uncharacterized protein (TIGR00299 family) protein